MTEQIQAVTKPPNTDGQSRAAVLLQVCLAEATQTPAITSNTSFYYNKGKNTDELLFP